LNKKEKERHSVKTLFTAIGLSSIKMVADEHRHVANHNKY